VPVTGTRRLRRHFPETEVNVMQKKTIKVRKNANYLGTLLG
jgi:hypothetical protein